MPTLPILFPSYQPGADHPTKVIYHSANSSIFGQLQQNGFWMPVVTSDGPKLAWFRRPGLSSSTYTLSGAIIGVTYAMPPFDSSAAQIAVTSNSKVWLCGSSSYTELTGSITGITSAPVSFVQQSGSDRVYVTGYNRPIYYFTSSAGSGTQVSDTDAPTDSLLATQLNNVMVVCRTDRTRFDWSSAGDYSVWDGEYANTEYMAGQTYGLGVANGLLYFFRDNYTEVWRDDGQSFSRMPYIIPIGIRGQESIIQYKNMFYLIGNDNVAYNIVGYETRVISDQNINSWIAGTRIIGEVIQASYVVLSGGKQYVAWNFGSSGDLVYDIDNKQWYVWNQYKGSSLGYYPLGIKCYGISPSGSIFYGKYDEGKILYLSNQNKKDFDTYEIRNILQTEVIDRGDPTKYKKCHELTLVFKRSSIDEGTPKNVSIAWRDEGSNTWSAALTAPMEAIGNSEYKAVFRRLGHYKMRTWQFMLNEDTYAGLYGAWERFEYGH